VGEAERGGQRAALSTVSSAVRRRRIVHKSTVSCLCRFGKARVARFNLGCEARLIAEGARAEPLIESPNSCLNLIRMYKEG
jgi:hypothetical protein